MRRTVLLQAINALFLCTNITQFLGGLKSQVAPKSHPFSAVHEAAPSPRSLEVLGIENTPCSLLLIRLCCRPQGLIRHGRVPLHHPLSLPAAERLDDRRREPLVERHGGAMVAQVVEREVPQPGGTRGSAEDAPDVAAFIGTAGWRCCAT